MTKAVVLFSGGIDSLAALVWSIKQYGKENTTTLYVNLGHRYAQKEIKAATEITKRLGVNFEIVETHFVGKKEKEDAHIPWRNLFLILTACYYLPDEGGDIIIQNVQVGETSIGDRTLWFNQSVEKLLSKVENKDVRVIAPFANYTKGQIVRWLLDNGIGKDILKLTVGCFSSEDGECGACPACLPDTGYNKILLLSGRGKKPSEVKVGDVLVGFDENTFEFKPTVVKEVYTRYVTEYLEIVVSPPSNSCYRKIHVTPEHPFYVVGRGWIEARNLRVGDVIATISQKEYARLRMLTFNPLRVYPESNPMRNPESRRKLSESLRKVFRERSDLRYMLSQRMKENNPMKDLEVRKKVSESIKRLYAEGKFRNPMESPEARKKISERMKKNNPMKNPEIAKRAGAKSGEVRKLKGVHKGDNNPAKRPGVRQKISESLRKNAKFIEECRNRMLDPEYRKKLAEARQGRPTSPERKLMEIVEKYNLPYQYVGDGSFWVGRPPMNPDFIDTLGKRVVIEVLGDYWHTQEEFENRRKMWEKRGYKCIGIWEHELKELKEEEVVRRLRQSLINGYIVRKIKRISLSKPTKVYNYHCEPYNNFVVNSCVVHNCFRKWIACESAGIECRHWFNNDLVKWEGTKKYAEKMLRGEYDNRRIVETLTVLLKYGIIKGIVVVDLDEVLCKATPWWDYVNAEPIRENIEKVNKLYNMGYGIWIHTSRFECDREVTERWLKEHGVKYHRLIMGKPWATHYIDDKNYLSLDEVLHHALEKEKVEKVRM